MVNTKTLKLSSLAAIVASLPTVQDTASYFMGDKKPRLENTNGIRFSEQPHNGSIWYEGSVLEPTQLEFDTLSFSYADYDSSEGTVVISYNTVSGEPIDVDVNTGLPTSVGEEIFDVVIATSSDVWDLQDTVLHILLAVKLHMQMGHAEPFITRCE